MNKFAAEQNAIVGAMAKIASANGLPLTYPVAQKIAEFHQYSPVLIMKTADDLTDAAVAQWKNDAMSMHRQLVASGYYPMVAALKFPRQELMAEHAWAPPVLLDEPKRPGWAALTALGAGLGGLAGGAAGAFTGANPLATGGVGVALGGALGAGASYLAQRRYHADMDAYSHEQQLFDAIARHALSHGNPGVITHVVPIPEELRRTL